MAAFADAGGIDYLVKIAKTDPRTFCTLLGKLLPTRVTGDAADEPVRIQVSWQAPTPEAEPRRAPAVARVTDVTP
jgi:hypothetical protein